MRFRLPVSISDMGRLPRERRSRRLTGFYSEDVVRVIELTHWHSSLLQAIAYIITSSPIPTSVHPELDSISAQKVQNQ